jgi:uncharacterized protein YecE (DUF72 family)
MDTLAGTSGYSYKEWKGNFYPEKIAPDAMLAHYGARLPAVEIDNTFYRLPRADVLAGWAGQVPERFRFAIKASRRITHFKRLKDAEDETSYLLRVVRALGPKLGAVLFQLPPNLKKDRDRLARFLDTLPESAPAAFEFREPSWFDEDILALLRERNRTLCVVDGDDADAAEVTPFHGHLARTAGWGYLRLRRESYDDDALRSWAQRIADVGWSHALVFFKHEDAGAAPAFAARFLEIASANDAAAAAATAMPPERKGPRRSDARAGSATADRKRA